LRNSRGYPVSSRKKKPTAAEIHHELCAVYSKNVTLEGNVSQWCRMLKCGRKDVHDKDTIKSEVAGHL
jgi:hypothetical protein